MQQKQELNSVNISNYMGRLLLTLKGFYQVSFATPIPCMKFYNPKADSQ